MLAPRRALSPAANTLLKLINMPPPVVLAGGDTALTCGSDGDEKRVCVGKITVIAKESIQIITTLERLAERVKSACFYQNICLEELRLFM